MEQLLQRLRAILGHVLYIEVHNSADLHVMYIAYKKRYMGELAEKDHFIRYYFTEDRMEVGYHDDINMFNECCAQFKISQIVAIKQTFEELFPEGVEEGHFLIS